MDGVCCILSVINTFNKDNLQSLLVQQYNMIHLLKTGFKLTIKVPVQKQ